MHEKETQSDSSYDPEIQEKKTSDTTYTHCSFNFSCECLKPEKIHETLNKHIKLVNEIQAMLMFRHPIPMVILIILVDICFYLYSSLNLNFYALFMLLIISRLIYKVFIDTVKQSFNNFLANSDQIPKGEGPNRIRSIEEVESFLNKVLKPYFDFYNIIKKLAHDETVVGMLIFAGILFFAFAITASINYFRLFVIAVNALLILPGVIFHPVVREQFQKIMEKIQKAAKDKKEGVEEKVEHEKAQ